MVDPITSVTATTGPFDTAAMQIAQAQAQAAAEHTNEVAFLQEIAKTNDATNAQALNSAPATALANDPLSNGLLNLDPSVNPTTAPPADPLADLLTTPPDPTSLAFLTEFGSNVATASTATSDSSKAQQLHDIAILQKDAVLLEEAANANSPIPLNSSPITVDLSPAAQGIVAGTPIAAINGSALLTPTQLTQISGILQPIANEPLTPALLQQIQAQFAAAQNPMQLNLNIITLAMNFIAGMQPSPNHAVENTVIQNDNEVVKPVSAIDRVAVEDSAIH